MYLDHAATTPLDPAVLEVMLPYLRGEFGNAASVHRSGQRARRAVEQAREQVAHALGADPDGVVFTSGATEADNQAMLGLARGARGGAMLTSPLEHAAVRSTALWLASAGHEVRWVEPGPGGAITPAAVAAALSERPDVTAVSLMLVNNETGVLTDIAAIAEVVHEHGALLMTDAVQGFGLEAVQMASLGADVLTVSAHKIHGPKGVGALVMREGLRLDAFHHGGEQERGLRPGTHDTAAIVGMGEAAARAAADRASRREKARLARDAFEAAATAVAGVCVNGLEAPRGVKHSNLRVEGVDGESLLYALDDLGVEASAGSACAAGSVEPSHVLLAMGLDAQAARSSLRFSFDHEVTEVQARTAAGLFEQAVLRCRAVVPS